MCVGNVDIGQKLKSATPDVSPRLHWNKTRRVRSNTRLIGIGRRGYASPYYTSLSTSIYVLLMTSLTLSRFVVSQIGSLHT